jgi:hypothetical protein
VRKLLFIPFLFLASQSHAVICQGITDAAYRIEVFKILGTDLTDEQKQGALEKDIRREGFAYVMGAMVLNYREANVTSGGDPADVSSRCFVGNIYEKVTGRVATPHRLKHFVEDYFPGRQFTE